MNAEFEKSLRLPEYVGGNPADMSPDAPLRLIEYASKNMDGRLTTASFLA